MTYTEYDVVYTVVSWQLPVAFLVAVLGVIITLRQNHLSALRSIFFVPGFVGVCWLSNFLILICLDMLLLPPLLSLYKFYCSSECHQSEL
jgi:hypothetical protein